MKEEIYQASQARVTSPLTVGEIFSTPHAPSRKSPSLKTHKGDTEVSIYHYDGMNDICMGVVGNNVRVCAVGTKLCGFTHSKKVTLHTRWYLLTSDIILSHPLCVRG